MIEYNLITPNGVMDVVYYEDTGVWGLWGTKKQVAPLLDLLPEYTDQVLARLELESYIPSMRNSITREMNHYLGKMGHLSLKEPHEVGDEYPQYKPTDPASW